MRRAALIKELSSRAGAIAALGATGLYVFGSVARDAASGDSDIDLFVDYDPESGFSLVELARLSAFLERELATRVDVTTRDSLHPAFNREIEAEAIRIF